MTFSSDGHVREEVELLEHHADVQPQLPDLLALARGCGGRRRALTPPTSMRARGRILEEVHAAQQRRLARPGPAEDHDHLALVHLHVDALEHLEVAESLLSPSTRTTTSRSLSRRSAELRRDGMTAAGCASLDLALSGVVRT